MLEMPRSEYHLDSDNPFFSKFKGRLPIKNVMTLFKFAKGSRVQHVLHALKYKNEPDLGVLFGRIYGEDLIQAGFKNKFDLIIPVPLHASRQRRRGYNQSEKFGKGLSEVMEIPCSDKFVVRKSQTGTQTNKVRVNLWKNVEDVFLVWRPEEVKGKRILLVDDVVTTGATLEACGQSLLEAGCSELSIACIAAAQ
jgi:ComF family protein